jgi:hypothetical protein
MNIYLNSGYKPVNKDQCKYPRMFLIENHDRTFTLFVLVFGMIGLSVLVSWKDIEKIRNEIFRF